MKQSQLKKSKLRKQCVVKISYERDYDDQAWSDDSLTLITPETHPDAFYRVTTEIRPPLVKGKARRKRYETLSKRQILKRVSSVGIRGAELKRIVSEIKSGPGITEMTMGITVLGWNVDVFRNRFGRRVTKAVFNFVQRRFMALDEGWQLMSSPGMSKFFSNSMKVFRKTNTNVNAITQSVSA